jgi:hypothetical protein
MSEPTNEYAGSGREEEIRFNVHPASWRNKRILAAQRRLAKKIRAEVGQYGAIDIDAFHPNEGAISALIIEGYDEWGDVAYLIDLKSPPTKDPVEFASFIDEASEQLVERVQNFNGRIPERDSKTDVPMEGVVHVED